MKPLLLFALLLVACSGFHSVTVTVETPIGEIEANWRYAPCDWKECKSPVNGPSIFEEPPK